MRRLLPLHHHPDDHDAGAAAHPEVIGIYWTNQDTLNPPWVYGMLRFVPQGRDLANLLLLVCEPPIPPKNLRYLLEEHTISALLKNGIN